MKTSIKLLLKQLLADVAITGLAWPERDELGKANFPPAMNRAALSSAA